MEGRGSVRLRALPEQFVYILTLCSADGENKMDLRLIAAIHAALDEVERDPNAGALLTAGEGKFFSNGVDLDFAARNPDKMEELLFAMMKLFARFLTFPMPTVAAVNGHAVGGGFMLALAHDYRFMRMDKGFIFMNEVKISMPLIPGAVAIVRSKLSEPAFNKAILAGHRFSAKEAETYGFVHGACSNLPSTLNTALQTAKQLAAAKFDRSTYQTLKREMYKSTVNDVLHGGLGFVSRSNFPSCKL